MTVPSDPRHDHFRHCPRCARPGFNAGPGDPLVCLGCQFAFFLNPAVAVGAVIRDEAGRVLLIRRAKDPGRGMLALVGGFVDRFETAESALVREVREEVGLEVTSFSALLSHPNSYEYRGVIYPVLDFYYLAHVRSVEVAADAEEVHGHEWRSLEDIDLEQIAFESMRVALRACRAADQANP